MPVRDTVNISVAPLISVALLLKDKWAFSYWVHSRKISILFITFRKKKCHNIAVLYYRHLSVHEVDVGAAMQCLCNNFNFTAGSDHLDFTNIKRISINHFSLCSQIVFSPNPDKNSQLLKWINGVSTICLSSHVQHQTCVHGHFKVRGISFTVRGLHAVMCDDDGSDSTHYYLMIYCNSLTMDICFVFRALLPSSPLLSPVMYFSYALSQP